MPQAYKYETAPFFSIKPKLDMGLFIAFCAFTWAEPTIVILMLRTILGSDQVNSGKNGVKHRNQQTITCEVLV